MCLVNDVQVGKIYTHKTDGGRYEVDSLPLSSGTMRRQGLEFICYHSVEDLRKFVREKGDFLNKMKLLNNNVTL